MWPLHGTVTAINLAERYRAEEWRGRQSYPSTHSQPLVSRLPVQGTRGRRGAKAFALHLTLLFFVCQASIALFTVIAFGWNTTLGIYISISIQELVCRYNEMNAGREVPGRTVTNICHSVIRQRRYHTRVVRKSLNRPVWLFLSFLIFNPASTAFAAFTHEAHYHLDSIRQNSLGAFCFYPGVLRDERPCTSNQLRIILDTHINNALGSGLSIAYYSTEDGAILGGTGWADWKTTTSPVAVCLSGAINDLPNAFVSTCRFSAGDDDLEDSHGVHVPECAMNLPQQRLTDGCYPASAQVAVQDGYLSDRVKAIITFVGNHC